MQHNKPDSKYRIIPRDVQMIRNNDNNTPTVHFSLAPKSVSKGKTRKNDGQQHKNNFFLSGRDGLEARDLVDRTVIDWLCILINDITEFSYGTPRGQSLSLSIHFPVASLCIYTRCRTAYIKVEQPHSWQRHAF